MPKPRSNRRLLTALILLLSLYTPDLLWALNPIQSENQHPGTSEWQLSNPALHHEIEGYASLTSVNGGESLSLFVSTTYPSYMIEVYRMGWYGGHGARRVMPAIHRAGMRQTPPRSDPLTGLIECDWRNPYVLRTEGPHDRTKWVSGVYLAKLTGSPSGKQSYIIFVVRDDARASDYLFQSSVTTYQAYNNWGGKSLYDFNSDGDRRAYRVSFNRPYALSPNPIAAFGNGAGDFLTTNSVPPSDAASAAGWEYNLVRWLEREGYDVRYSTSLDTHAQGSLVRRHKVWVSVGHDEYWTWSMRANLEDAVAHGVSLAFFAGNVSYWQIRLEPSPIRGDPDRTMVGYKDAAWRADPYALDADPENDRFLTVQWREPPVNRPEEALIGVMYDGNPVDQDLVVQQPDHWVFWGTGLRIDDRISGLLGYEADHRFGHGPPGTTVLAHSAYGVGDETAYADMTIYRHLSGAYVFAAGTIQWSWGLDDFNVPELRASRLAMTVQQITRNVLAGLAGNTFPSAILDGPPRSHVGVPAQFDARRSLDPDGRITQYHWRFGDGAESTAAAPRHTYAHPGLYHVDLTVLDDRGAAHRVTSELHVDEPGSNDKEVRP